MNVLLIKMSSLGDVVHTLPALSDAAAALGDEVSFDWVVEEAFAPIAARHPAVGEVLPVGWRRWRRGLHRHGGDLRAFVSMLRSRRYDLVLDAQGLVKSAVVTALARGSSKTGLARGSAREAAATLAYRQRIEVPRNLHAIDRLRRLFAGALGYPMPGAAPDYGIAVRRTPSSGRAHCVLLHGTTWDSKHYPEALWQALASRAGAAGYDVELPWGDAAEHERARRIAAGGGGSVLPRLPLGGVMDRLGSADLVIGVDSGLAHLAAALEVPTLVLYGSTSSTLTGCRGRQVANLQAQFPCSPCLRRTCGYTGPHQTWQDMAVVPACYATLPPDTVWHAALELLDADRVLHL